MGAKFDPVKFMAAIEHEELMLAPDVVNSPPHYNSAGIECIDAMTAMVEQADVQPHLAYCWQNAFKYLWRWPYKNGVEDLRKARWYIDRLISQIERSSQ
jgi:hypothetical protein